jgi:Ca2+-binding EF-hand superfamily protein
MKKFTLFVSAVFLLNSVAAFAQSGHSKNFDLMDGDKDGAITKKEIHAHHKKRHDKMDHDKDGKISEKDAAKHSESAARAFKNVDKNGDGYISFEEGVAVEEKRFEIVDTNKDGKISKEEYEAHLQKSSCNNGCK